jgi:hypothetical protein
MTNERIISKVKAYLKSSTDGSEVKNLLAYIKILEEARDVNNASS